jgi:hypothetical protein
VALHDIHYQHWGGTHEGIWRRRGVIASQGLRACLSNRWMRYLLTLSWGLGLALTALMFVMGQLLVEDSLVMQWSSTMRGGAQALLGGLARWLADHPEVSVRTAENALFYAYSGIALTVNLLVVMLAVPHLMTRDLSSNALLVYASKALTRWDYLIGKFGTILGLLCLTWVGPACLAWLLGNLLAPKWHFFWHGKTALAHTLGVSLGASLFLALLALAVSAVSAKEKTVVGVWLILWLLGNGLVPISQKTNPSLQFLSFRENLRQVASFVFQPAADLERIQANVPIFGEMLRQAIHQRPDAWMNPKIGGSSLGLGFMGLAAVLILNARTRTE